MYIDSKNTNTLFKTPFIKSAYDIPAWVIFYNAAGKLSEADF